MPTSNPKLSRDYDRARLGGFLSLDRRYASAASCSRDGTWPSTISSNRFIASETLPALSLRSALASSALADRTSDFRLLRCCQKCRKHAHKKKPRREAGSLIVASQPLHRQCRVAST